jgi:hypothetical protein
MVIVLPEIESVAPIKAGGRVNGTETSVSELLRHGVAVNPTGSVTTLWAKPGEAATTSAPNEKMRRIFSSIRRESDMAGNDR